jgi:uncharacterized membrane protein
VASLKAIVLVRAVVLRPGVILALLAVHGFAGVAAMLDAVAALFGFGDRALRVMAVVALVLGCLVSGLVVRTQIGRRVRRVAERGLLERLPAYAELKRLSAAFAGVERSADPMVMVRPGAAAGEAPGRLIEDTGEVVTVDLRFTPIATIGQLVVLPADRARRVEGGVRQLLAVTRNFSLGLSGDGRAR